jgi:hypothetical protein
MAVVAQLVEHSVVIRIVAGSSPVDRPIFSLLKKIIFFEISAWHLRRSALKTHTISRFYSVCAAVVKLVDTLDLGSSALGRGGSSPSSRTI